MMISSLSQMAFIGVLFMTLGLSWGAKLRGEGGAEQEAAKPMENETRKLDLCNLAVSSSCCAFKVALDYALTKVCFLGLSYVHSRRWRSRVQILSSHSRQVLV
jgi:hypothetical protein